MFFFSRIAALVAATFVIAAGAGFGWDSAPANTTVAESGFGWDSAGV